ncbi:membrane protein insertion efficiency factor YidD [Polynucleobacter sphagniphilus]|uniref:membrane protein insertion efficiency factor YidD n=1 Tax=Polynucleobacter sphagniphilus TaxID=1743169 RepID=UPI002472F8AC|nr:membrane protein insertion efficiency factor YidD [Polynucleobacter sphagniphilus]
MKKRKTQLLDCLIRLIIWYRRDTSARVLALSKSCIFQPTCSRYMCVCLRRFGAAKGLSLGFKRFTRCSALRSDGGYDPVPKILQKEK